MQTHRSEKGEEREELQVLRNIASELSSVRGTLHERKELVREQKDVLQEQSFVLAFKEKLKGTLEAKGFFKLLARQAVMKKREQVCAMEEKKRKGSIRSEATLRPKRSRDTDSGSAVPFNCFSVATLFEATREAEKTEDVPEEEVWKGHCAHSASRRELASSKNLPK